MAKTVERAESGSTHHAVWIVDSSGATTSLSPAVRELLGIDDDHEPATPLDELITILGTTRSADDEGERWVHVLLTTPSGVSLMEAREQPHLDADGVLTHTAYHLLAPGSRTAHLLRQVDLMVEAQQIAHVGSWYWYPAENQIWWSDELYRLYRKDPSKSPSVEDSQRLIHPDDRGALEAAVASAFAGQPHIEWEGRLMLPEGGVRWIREVADAEFDANGELIRLCGTAQDITELRRAASLVAEAQERLVLMQAVAEGAVQTATLAEVIELTVRAVIQHTYWEPITAHLLPGWMEAEAIVALTLPHRDPDAATSTASTAASEQLLATVQRSAEVTAVPLDGGPEARTLAGVPVVLNSEAVAVLQFEVDRAGLDEPTVNALNQLAALLASVAEREHAAHSLREARDAATLAAARKAELLAVMSHEIRTPMSGTLGLIDLLLETPLDERQTRMANAMREAGDALLRVVNAVLDLSRADSGRLVATTVEFDPRAVVESAVSMLAAPAQQKGLELILDIDQAVPERVIGDPDLLGQAITNLCANAVKFTDEGYVRVALGPDLEDPLGDSLATVVSDTGVGIPNAETGWVFEPFAQSDQSSTRHYDGTGLGLSITRSIAETLGGSIRCRSEVAVGSSFTLSIPLPATGRRQPTHRWLEDTAVLIGGCHPVAALAMSRLLDAAGAEVSTCGSVAALHEQLDTWDTARPRRLAIVDGSVTTADDQLAALLAQAEQAGAALLVLVPSASADSERAVRDLELTALTKPVRRDALYRAMRQAFGEEEPPSPATASAQVAPGRALKVLIVEDNPVNQLVAAGFVESLGHRGTVIDNGTEASLVLRAEHDYDVVLMDCRMPGMDGYETTRLIREHEAGSGLHVPIVALTASVLLDEQERAYDSGMDGVLAKPIDRVKLASALQLWGDQPRVGPTPCEELAPLLAVERVRELRGLSKDGVDLFSRARRSFLDSIDADLASLGEAVADESGALPRIAHSLAGSAHTVGLARLGTLLSSLERRCAIEPADSLHRRFAEIQLTAQASLGVLREF